MNFFLTLYWSGVTRRQPQTYRLMAAEVGVDKHQVAELPIRRTSPAFDGAERAALAPVRFSLLAFLLLTKKRPPKGAAL